MRIVISHLAGLVAVALIACGGTTDDGDGAATGGSNGNGQAGSASSAGSNAAGSAGQSSSGSASGGNSNGGSGVGGVSSAGSGGTIVIIGGGGTPPNGGTGSVDPRCPSKAPSGTCGPGLVGLVCQYEPGSNCLCYPTPIGVYLPCTKVDPTCTAATPGEGGSGGFSTKIALPPDYKCTCYPMSSSWTCGYGI